MNKRKIEIEVDDIPVMKATEENYSSAEGRAAREQYLLEGYLKTWQQVASIAASKMKELHDHIGLCKRIQGK